MATEASPGAAGERDLLCTIPASWVTTIIPNVQPAARAGAAEADAAPAEVGPEAQPGAAPEQQQDERPARRCPSVAPPASTRDLRGVQVAGSGARGSDAEQRDEDQKRRRSTTTLLATGAQVNGPNTPRAFSTSPSSAYSP